MRVAALAMIVVATTAATEPKAPARLPSVSVKHGTPYEQQTKQQLLDLLARYDTRRWTFTDTVVIDRTAIPHSHPVLTLHTRYASRPMRLLAAYLHENMHRWVEDRAESKRAAIDELRKTYPVVPVGFPRGARDEESTYTHLLVCWLENEAMIDVAGASAAEEVLSAMTEDHYTWVYERVRDDNEVIARIVRKYGLNPRISGFGSGLKTR